MSKGRAYGVGVGPGDPELMTIKAYNLIREAGVIAVPGRDAREATAYRIAESAVPEIRSKELVAVSMPMVSDEETLKKAHRAFAETIEKYLDEGRDVVYITLGDPSIYCSFSYIQHILESDGYETELVPGIPSFCAAAARLGISLAERDEMLHIVPAVYNAENLYLQWPGNYVLMKSASRMSEVKEMLSGSGLEVQAAENLGMDNEKLYRSIEDIPDDAGYYSLIIARNNK